MSIRNVALIGGTGTLGAPILEALKASPFTIHVLNRASSKSKYTDTNVITIPDDVNVPDLTTLFEQNAIDALVIAIAGKHVDEPKRLIEAAFNANIKRIIPADFGSCDSQDAKTNELMPLYKAKEVVRNYLISLQNQDRGNGKGNLTWTSLITGHFFDWGLPKELLCFDVKQRKAYIMDGGDIKFSASNLDFIARGVVSILQNPEETKNRVLYVHQFYVTQNELLAVLEKVTGATWEKVDRSSEEEIKVIRPKMLAGSAEAYEEIVAVWGVVASDWKNKADFANELLGLKEENAEHTVRRVLTN
jgi:uncharacterized protein YbjT (DUF2867 family)